jgi:leucyl aminopeptidase
MPGRWGRYIQRLRLAGQANSGENSLMPSYLPASTDLRVTQHVGRANSKLIEPLDQLLLILPARVPAALWRKVPQGAKLKALLAKSHAGATPALRTRLPNKRQTLVVAGKFKPGSGDFERLTFARQLVSAALGEKAGSLGILAVGFSSDEQAALCKAFVAAALAAGFNLPAFKKRPSRPRIRSVKVIGLDADIDLRRTAAEANGNNLARWLTALPPNKLDAINYSTMVKELAAEHGWAFNRYSPRQLESMGAGAFLAVAQGNDNDSAGLVHLRYRPDAASAPPEIALVGKGIIFDTGGTNLKPFASMLDMHGDMQGSAVALGTLLAISSLGLQIAADCWLAITENRTGPNAYKPQDVVTAANGKTIQTVHTDAEGRMVLADALTFASREKPKLVIDYATLTGAVVNAITTRYSGVFTNRPEWHGRLQQTGIRCGERVWPFPIGKEFLSDLKSDTADIQQCAAKAPGDHILAGSFLAEFVENDTPWIHVDLAASTHKGGLAHVPTEITGFGVRYTMSLLLDDDILQAGG